MALIAPLRKALKINLVPQDFQKLSNHLNCLGSQYGYDHLFKQAATTQTIIPAIPGVAAVAAIAADLIVVPPIFAVPAVAAVPAILEVTFYGGFRNMIKNYSADNLKIAVINASVIWDNDSFTAQIRNDYCKWFSNDTNKSQANQIGRSFTAH